MTITYTKLEDGSWGVRGVQLQPGAVVQVVKRDGTTRQETIGRIVQRDPSGVLSATIGAGARAGHGHPPAGPSPSRGAGGPPREALPFEAPDAFPARRPASADAARSLPLEIQVRPGAVVQTAEGVTLQLTIDVRNPSRPVVTRDVRIQ